MSQKQDMDMEYKTVHKLKNQVRVIHTELIKKRRLRSTIYIVCILWIAVLAQLFVNRWFVDDSKLVDAFTKTNSAVLSSNLYFVADMGGDYFSEEDEKNLLQYVSSEIGLTKECKITKVDNQDAITTMHKSDQAQTVVKLLHNKERKKDGTNQIRRYLTIDLTLYDGIDRILSYKRKSEKMVSKLDAVTYESQVTFTGTYEGNLSIAEKNAIAEQFMKDLQADVVIENREEELYTIYAYTGLIGDYIKSDGKKINTNIAFTFDEIQNKTKLYVATPILNQDY